MYMETDGWRPTHLWLLLEVRGREGIGYAEAGLIRMMHHLDIPHNLNMNFKHRDYGGTGPRLDEHMHATFSLLSRC